MTTQRLDEPTPVTMRTVLGHFCTGLAVITGHDDERPLGFEHDAGDHTIVVARVTALHPYENREPLLFDRGGYGGLA
jgi:hypothetical protein